MDITKLNVKYLTSSLKDVYKSFVDVAYFIFIEEPLMVITLIKFIIKDNSLYNSLYQKLDEPLEGSSTKVFIQEGPGLLSVVSKVLVKGKWYYLLGNSHISESDFISKLRITRQVKYISNKGKVINSTPVSTLDNTEWLEYTLRLDNNNNPIKIIISKAIDYKFYNHLLRTTVSYVRTRNVTSYTSSKLVNIIANISQIFDMNHRLDRPVSLNYDPLSTPLNLNVSDYGTHTLTPTFTKEMIASYTSFFRSWIISLLLSAIVTSSFFFLRDIPVNKHLFSIGSLLLFSYLLISGFVFFIKKYRYGKYTTAMHRFWRRTFSIFWALEGFLFIVFMYLTILSNQEPFFMYDNIQFFKNYTYSWRLFLSENIVILFIISLLHYTLIRHKDITGYKLNIIIILVSVIFFFLTYIEFYQFFYTISHYNPTAWIFDYESNKWVLDYETTQTKRTRILLHFITICLIAKFWHFVFILLFWVFTACKWVQMGNLSYQLIGSNLQNGVILYLLNWILMYPWLKVAFRKFMYRHYKWLYVNFRSIGLRVMFNDLFLYYSSISNNVISYSGNLKLHWAFLYYSITGSDILRSDSIVPLI